MLTFQFYEVLDLSSSEGFTVMTKQSFN